MASRYRDERADELRERYRAAFGGPEIPVPADAIAQDLLGLRIDYRRDLSCSGMLLPRSREILVNSATPRELGPRRSFTIAHEIGHWICHCRAGERTEEVYCRAVDLTEDTNRALEREANVFAAELLMPEPEVREEWERTPRLAEMAWQFGVSESAMHWRLFNFGLLQEAPGIPTLR